MGATDVIDPLRNELPATILEQTDGLGADAVVVTAGLPEVLEQALASARRQGVVNLFAGFPPGTSVPFDPNAVHYNEIIITGSQNATPDQYRPALQLLTVMPQAAVINTHRLPIDEGRRAYESRLGKDGRKALVIL